MMVIVLIMCNVVNIL